MKRIGIIGVCILLLFTSCTPGEKKEEEVVQDEKEKKELSIVPSYKLSKENYRMLLPYESGAARGVIVNQLANRVDIDEVEEGLRRHSKDYFDPETYIFREGQFLSSETVYGWLGRKLTKEQLNKAVEKEVQKLRKAQMTVDKERIRNDLQQGINPAINNKNNVKEQKKKPKYLSHIVEQNFLVTKDKQAKVAGVSIGLSMKSVYRFYTEDKEKKRTFHETDIPKDKMIEQGKKNAQEILSRLRTMEGLENVPIMFAIYQEEDESSPVPGSFVAKTLVDKGQNEIGKWETIKEKNVLFPSNEAEKYHVEESEVIKRFSNEVADYFPNYVGVIGRGFYINEELNKLVLDIPIEFYGKGEVLGFTQYVYGLAKELLSNNYDVEINIKSSTQMESIIYREAGKDDLNVHIFQ
ncbi:MAG TPA: CamS family sex pheromone protein [Cerasibacillus sp.]|uniref:CamS family sex pheromone protein n=1 Tax=Cerasibacillus sp. TaxID=2498711 RepID=UPI002F41ECB9